MTEPGTMPPLLLTTLARGGKTGNRVATAICRLVTNGAILGELEEVDIVSDGETRTIKMMPQIWLDRLTLALERGAFESMPVKRIVERILIPPEAT